MSLSPLVESALKGSSSVPGSPMSASEVSGRLSQGSLSIPSVVSDSQHLLSGSDSKTPTNASVFSASSTGPLQGSTSSRMSNSGEEKNNSPELIEERSQWLTDVLLRYPQFLAMRERSLPLSGGYSFANVTHTHTVSALASVNRYTILELISQHLRSIGMYQTAEVLEEETGHTFQVSDHPWDRTDLHLLTSLAVSHREDAWNLSPEVDHRYVEEAFDEDFFASPYREDPKTLYQEFYDPTLNVVYDGEKHSLAHIKCCSLKRFVIYFATVVQKDSEELDRFFLSLHSITSASHFLEHLVTLYDMKYDEEKSPYPPEVLKRIHLNIMNLIASWLKFPIGKRTLKLIRQFLNRARSKEECDPFVKRCIPKILKAMSEINGPPDVPEEKEDPVIPKPEIIFKYSLQLLDPEPIELARQITLIYLDKYNSIHSMEFIIGISKGRTTIQTPTLAEFLAFGESLTQMIAESFINATDKKATFQRIMEVVRALDLLRNLDALSCILRFLRRKDVQEIGEASEQVKQEIDTLLEKTGDDEEKRGVYEDLIKKQFDVWGSVIPHMHAELQRGGRKSVEEPDYINGLINWAKLDPHAERCVYLNRFQNPYYKMDPKSPKVLIAIPQIQKVIMKGPEMSLAELDEKLEEYHRLLTSTD